MFRIVEKMNNHYTWSLELIRCWSDSDIPISHYASVSKNEYWIVIQKTRTVQVRVPYPHCTGAARTKNHLCGRTLTNRDPLNIPL